MAELRDSRDPGLDLGFPPQGSDTHTTLPVHKAAGMDTKFSFITSSSKRPVGYSFRNSEEEKVKRAGLRWNGEVSEGSGQ